MADLLGMNLSPPPGVLMLPSLPGVPRRDGDLRADFDGVFLSEVLSLFSPELGPPSLPGDFWRPPWNNRVSDHRCTVLYCE